MIKYIPIISILFFSAVLGRHVQKDCVDFCKMIRSQSQAAPYSNRTETFNSCVSSCGKLCISAESESLQALIFEDCLESFENCESLDLTVCPETFNGCINATSSLSCSFPKKFSQNHFANKDSNLVPYTP